MPFAKLVWISYRVSSGLTYWDINVDTVLFKVASQQS